MPHIQLTFEDLENLHDWLEDRITDEPDAIDETPTNVDFSEASSSTPIERVITNFLTHLEPGTLPTLEQAQAILILDSINAKYN